MLFGATLDTFWCQQQGRIVAAKPGDTFQLLWLTEHDSYRHMFGRIMIPLYTGGLWRS